MDLLFSFQSFKVKVDNNERKVFESRRGEKRKGKQRFKEDEIFVYQIKKFGENGRRLERRTEDGIIQHFEDISF